MVTFKVVKLKSFTTLNETKNTSAFFKVKYDGKNHWQDKLLV